MPGSPNKVCYATFMERRYAAIVDLMLYSVYKWSTAMIDHMFYIKFNQRY